MFWLSAQASRRKPFSPVNDESRTPATPESKVMEHGCLRRSSTMTPTHQFGWPCQRQLAGPSDRKYSQASTTEPSGNLHIGSGPDVVPPFSSQNTAAGFGTPGLWLSSPHPPVNGSTEAAMIEIAKLLLMLQSTAAQRPLTRGFWLQMGSRVIEHDVRLIPEEMSSRGRARCSPGVGAASAVRLDVS